VKLAIRKHLRDFLAIIALLIVASVVSVGILKNQRLTAPSWVPVFGKDFYELNAEFQSAQAVTPGQGQTVNVAGIRVGEISSVHLRNGRAVIRLRIDEKGVNVYRDAHMLLRPKTGLRDMVVELDPGTKAAGRVPEGGTIQVGQTAPDVNLDEILAVLDTDTRTWLTVLLGDGERGLRGRGDDLAKTFAEIDPLNRDLRKLNEGLAKRRANIKRVIHNFSLLAGELGTKDDQIATLVDSSNAVFASFARQEAALRSTVSELPSTLTTTRTALGKAETLGRTLGPSLESLRPAARALGPALRDVRPFMSQTTPVLRDEIRPLVRAAMPVVAELRPAMRDLASAAPDLTSSLKIVNRAVDMIAYNPPGVEEGYLFWFAWVNHLGASVFSTQDAHGPIRRGLFIANCNALDIVDNIAQSNPTLGVIIALLNPVRGGDSCPKTIASSR
jgi:phospholipid/cholesterol/gamma-HCH transport system substrate-binding protein